MDYGKTWTAIINGIPHSMLSYAQGVREDPVRRGLLFVGTGNGFSSTTGSPPTEPPSIAL
ncbi:MAG TPA: hypothetical protein VGH38_32655 [Bryobacteraceae bacterium]